MPLPLELVSTRLGLHVSISGALSEAVDRALERGCNTFQMFTRNPRSWKFKELTRSEVDAFRSRLMDSAIEPVIAHVPYLLNLASPKNDVYQLSVYTLGVELERCGRLGIPYLVTHLGSHLGKGMEVGFDHTIDAINRTFSEVENGVILLLENTSGGRNSMGGRFEDLRRIIDGVHMEGRVGVCFDTSHGFASGYDLRGNQAVWETMGRFDDVLGLKRLKMVHLNDSKADLGTGVDRHEHIGMGRIGVEGFKAILTHGVLKELPLILETPVMEPGDDIRNLEAVKRLYKLANMTRTGSV